MLDGKKTNSLGQGVRSGSPPFLPSIPASASSPRLPEHQMLSLKASWELGALRGRGDSLCIQEILRYLSEAAQKDLSGKGEKISALQWEVLVKSVASLSCFCNTHTPGRSYTLSCPGADFTRPWPPGQGHFEEGRFGNTGKGSEVRKGWPVTTWWGQGGASG